MANTSKKKNPITKQKWTYEFVRNTKGGWTLELGTQTCRITGSGKTKNEALYEVLNRVAELANTRVSFNGYFCYLHCRINHPDFGA